MGNTIKDLTGRRFGKLKVIRLVKNPKVKDIFHGSWWLCECDCGIKKEIRGTQLRNGHSKSCGCMSMANWFKRSGRTEPNIIFYQYKKSAKERKLEFKLTFDEFSKLILMPCYYCGEKASRKINYYKWTNGFVHNGVDRLDSKIGYIKENCVPCCTKCNFAKRESSIEEFYKWVKKINKNLERRNLL